MKNNPEYPILHGRLFTVGLALLEPELRLQMEKEGVFSELLKEIQEKPFESILSKQGLILFKRPAESVPSHNDDPIATIDDDLLGRGAFAQYLVKLIRYTKKAGAYCIHLCGPWGSGKSTILNFIKEELCPPAEKRKAEMSKSVPAEQGKKWVIIDFNAWQNQNISPPWWPLYEKIYKTSKKHFGGWLKIHEWWWHLFKGNLIYIICVILAMWIVFLSYRLLKVKPDMSNWKTAAETISAVIALITTIGGGIFGFTRSLSIRSSKAARSFEEYVNDPMSTIKERFTSIVDNMSKHGFNMLIMIDDLDRCKSEYVVSLLEGIQTMFKWCDIVFLVAADRTWLNACYEEVYSNLKENVREPGKRLGTLFLEKAFQLCAPMPGITPDLKSDFWCKLLNIKTQQLRNEIESAKKKVKDTFSNISNEGEIINQVSKSRGDEIATQLALREEAVMHLVQPQSVERLEHGLKEYAPLINNNPRSMKRLVNMYSVNLTLSMLSFADIDRDTLVRWTILTMRWPILAEFLTKFSEMKNTAAPDINEEIRKLLDDTEVKNVLSSDNDNLTLDEIKTCALLTGM